MGWKKREFEVITGTVGYLGSSVETYYSGNSVESTKEILIKTPSSEG